MVRLDKHTTTPRAKTSGNGGRLRVPGPRAEGLIRLVVCAYNGETLLRRAQQQQQQQWISGAMTACSAHGPRTPKRMSWYAKK